MLDVNPAARGDAMIAVGNARFTVLTERLIRLEYDPEGHFEDRPTQTVWYRQQPVPAFDLKRTDTQVSIETEAFSLRYQCGKAFTPETLTIRIKPVDTMWRPGDRDSGNLKGTTRTLDYVNGCTPLNEGLISRSGWALLDDSQSFAFNQDHWLEPRAGSQTDWYFFAYGRDYKAGLRDYCAISGDIPLIPRWFWVTGGPLLGLYRG